MGASGVGSSYPCYRFRLSHCLMLVGVLVHKSELGWVGRFIIR